MGRSKKDGVITIFFAAFTRSKYSSIERGGFPLQNIFSKNLHILVDKPIFNHLIVKYL